MIKTVMNFLKAKKTIIFVFVGLFLLSSGVSMVVFSFLGKSETTKNTTQKTTTGKEKRIDVTAPKTEACPINGMLFTKVERETWEKRRPILAMIENSADARPQSGVSYADVVYEAVAEGGITRFMGVFYCDVISEAVNIAPVRSARIYFLDLASEYGAKPIFMHVGGANNFSGSGDTAKEVRALETLETLGWRVPKGNDFDTTYDSGYPVFWRNYERLDHEVATEHTMMASIDEAYKQAEKRKLTNTDTKGTEWDTSFVPWKFAKDAKVSSPNASNISFMFWENKSDYDVVWKYDVANNLYLRSTGGKAHMDLENSQQLSVKNVVVVFASEKGPVDKNMHMYYKVTGTGKAMVFQNGEVIEGTWQKAKRESRMILLDSKGKEITFVAGKIWFEILPQGNEVVYN